MLELNWKPLRSCLTAGLVAAAAVAALAPVAPAWAQNRTLPDFTDLVEQVGPSVVNIRTTEKVASRGNASASAISTASCQDYQREYNEEAKGHAGPITARQKSQERQQYSESALLAHNWHYWKRG